MFKTHFKCGTIRPDRSDKTLKYEVRSIKKLAERVVPHFQKYPLFSGKQKEFKSFSEICFKMYRKEHLTETGFRDMSSVSLNLESFC